MNILNVFIDFFMLVIILFFIYCAIKYFMGVIHMALSQKKIKKLFRLTCTQCGTVFNPYDRIDGCPAGVQLVMQDKSIVNLCYKCICEQNFYGLKEGDEIE